MKSESFSVVSDSLRPHGLHSPWNSPGQNTGVGSLSLLQGSSQHKDQTQISRIAGGFFTNWATEKPQKAALNGTESCCCLVAKSCLTLCGPMDSSPPGSSVHGISQTRILEGVAISFSMRSSRPRDRNYISCIDRWILYHWATREAHWILQWRVITFGRVLCN